MTSVRESVPSLRPDVALNTKLGVVNLSDTAFLVLASGVPGLTTRADEGRAFVVSLKYSAQRRHGHLGRRGLRDTLIFLKERLKDQSRGLIQRHTFTVSKVDKIVLDEPWHSGLDSDGPVGVDVIRPNATPLVSLLLLRHWGCNPSADQSETRSLRPLGTE